jgi:hypothetical protein
MKPDFSENNVRSVSSGTQVLLSCSCRQDSLCSDRASIAARLSKSESWTRIVADYVFGDVR